MRKGLIIFVLVCILVVSFSGDVLGVDCNGIKLLMHMDNDSNVGEDDTHVYDWSGNGNNGTVIGAVFNAYIGKFGGAFEFDGVGDVINISNSASIQISQDITVSVWFNMDSWKEADILEKGGNGGYMLWTAPSAGNSISWGRQGSSAGQIYSIIDFNNRLNEWIHIAGTYDGATLKFYVNGVLDNQKSAITSFTNSGPLRIGDGVDSFFNGTIDEVAIWNRSLSATEISDLYNSDLPINCGSSSSCSLADTSGNNIIEIGELISYISQWKSGTVTIGELITAIGEWKNGC